MNSTEEPITPKTSHRVIDSEALNSDRAKAKSSEQQAYKNRSSKQNGKPLEAKAESKTPLLTHLKRAMIAIIAVTVIAIGYWLYGGQEGNWEIEKINELQTKVAQLKVEVEQLKATQNDFAKKVQQSPAAELSEADQTRLALVDQLQSNVEALQTQLNDLIASANEPQSSVDKIPSVPAMAPQPVDNENLPALENVQSELSNLQQKVDGLSTQIASQQALVEEVDPLQEILSEIQIQQWILQINTQWILSGNIGITQKNLLALEQAIGMSTLQQKNRLLRLIGEDMNALQQQSEQPKPSAAIGILHDWIISMPLVAMKPIEVSHETIQESAPQEAPTPQNLWDRIQQKLAGLFTVRKRDADSQLTHAERLVQQDVLKERALLLLDRIDWAMTIESPQLLQNSRQDFEKFMLQTFPEKRAEFNELYAPVQQFQLTAKHALKIVEGM